MNQPWYCTRCGTENHPNSIECLECRQPRPPHTYPAGYAPPPPGYPASISNYIPPAPRKASPFANVLITCAVVILVLLILCGMAALALPNFIKVKEKAKEAEVKQNLHSIQLAIERYAVDHGGTYPEYLIGGEAKCARTVDATDENGGFRNDAFTEITDCEPLGAVSDPLLREGYLEAYPSNPFTRVGSAIHMVQGDTSFSSDRDDPLRNGSDSGLAHGTRFGPYCVSMGNMLADVRFPLALDEAGAPFESGADVEYQFWDMWEGEKPYPFMPGAFFYKSCNPTLTYPANMDFAGEEVSRTAATQYVLGGYGSIRTEGYDMLGAELPVTGQRGKQEWTYLRSKASTDPGEVNGCPFLIESEGGKVKLTPGNPNGVRDAIVLMLTSGEE